MERTLISFNLPNMITIGIMGMIFYGGMMLVAQFMQNRSATAGG